MLSDCTSDCPAPDPPGLYPWHCLVRSTPWCCQTCKQTRGSISMSVEVSDWSIHTVKLTNLPKYFFFTLIFGVSLNSGPCRLTILISIIKVASTYSLNTPSSWCQLRNPAWLFSYFLYPDVLCVFKVFLLFRNKRSLAFTHTVMKKPKLSIK